MNLNLQQIGNLLVPGGGQAPGVGLFNPGQSALLMPEQIRNVQLEQLRQGAGAQRMNLDQLVGRAGVHAQKEEGKKAMTNILMNLSGQGSGRNIPAYNNHEQQGRDGLVDPSLTGQQTTLPIPFNRQWDLAANLQAHVNALPPETYRMNEQIKQTVDSQVPQAQQALKYSGTIYEKTPESFVTNRLNLALQRKREQSIYAVV